MEKPLLKKCKACDKEISRHSPFCQNCGHPQGRPLFVWLLGAFLVLLILFYIFMTLFCLCNIQEYRVFGPEQERGVESREEVPPSE